MPLVIVLVMAFLYFRFKEVPAVKGVLHGASAAAVALTLAMVIKTGKTVPDGRGPGGAVRGWRSCSTACCGGRCWACWRSSRRSPALGVAAGRRPSRPRVSTYLQLIALFGVLSLLSIGGGNAVLPDMHLQAVHQHHWLTDTQFADIFSISQTAPGPSILIVTHGRLRRRAARSGACPARSSAA